MRKYIGPLIALGVFLVLLLAVLLTQGNNNTAPVGQSAARATITPADTQLQILNLPASDPVTGLEVKTITSTVTLKLEGDAWKQTAPSALTLDSPVVSDTVRQLTTVRGTTLIPPDKAGDLAAYGLDKPTMTITLNAASGPKVLQVGALNPASNNYYVKLLDQPKVWAVSSFYVTTLQTWLTKPPTPAPTILPPGDALTPLPSLTPSPSSGPPATAPPPPTSPLVTTAPPGTPAPSPTT